MVAILEPHGVPEGRIPKGKNAVARSLWKTSGCSLLFFLTLGLTLCPSDNLQAPPVLALSWPVQDRAVHSVEPAP